MVVLFFLFIALYSISVSMYGKALQKINIQFNVYKDNNRENTTGISMRRKQQKKSENDGWEEEFAIK